MAKWDVVVTFPVEAETAREAKKMVLDDIVLDEELLDSVRIQVKEVSEKDAPS